MISMVQADTGRVSFYYRKVACTSADYQGRIRVSADYDIRRVSIDILYRLFNGSKGCSQVITDSSVSEIEKEYLR